MGQQLLARTLTGFGTAGLAAVLWMAPSALAQEDAGGEELAQPTGDAQEDQDLDSESKVQEESATDEGIGLTLQDRIRAVSRKVFIKAGRFELEPFYGASTNDAFFLRNTLGARASYHLFDSLSLDAGGAWNFWTQPLDPVRTVRNELNGIPDEAALYGYGDVGVTFAPVYGKFALMSEYVIHFDAFVSGGVGAVFDSNQYTFFGTQPADIVGQQVANFIPSVSPAAQIGIGTRVFLTRWLVARVDLRDYVYPAYRNGISTIQTLLMLNVGFGFYLPWDFEYEYTAARVVDG